MQFQRVTAIMRYLFYLSVLFLLYRCDDGVSEEYVENTPPVVSTVTVDATTELQGYLGLTATASDADGDILTYIWACGEGSLRSSEATAQWYFPADTGEFSISVKAIDHRGGSSLATAIIARPSSTIRIVDITQEGER